jgi:hypothetical protein
MRPSAEDAGAVWEAVLQELFVPNISPITNSTRK